jgi:AcrR family transcriptional regulator
MYVSGSRILAMPERRRQAERSETTRRALIDAAIASLLDRGWPGTTAVEVCTRAGVTRGALVHHFPNLPALLAAALADLAADMMRLAPPPATDLAGLIDTTWYAFGSPRFKALLEAWLATVNDADLRVALAPVFSAFLAMVDPDAMAVPALRTDRGRTHYLMAREAMLGLAVWRAANGGTPADHEDAVLALLRQGAAAIDEDVTSSRRKGRR